MSDESTSFDDFVVDVDIDGEDEAQGDTNSRAVDGIGDDDGDAALQKLLDEAESLMTNINTDDSRPSVAYDGFSIDSDNEDDDDGHNKKPKSPASGQVSGSGKSYSNGDHGASGLDHPLSAESLATTAAAPTSSQSTGPPARSYLSDNFKQQTSRFASNLANMAQKAADQVAAVAAVQPLTVHGGPVPLSQSYSDPRMQLQSPHQNPLSSSSAAPTMMPSKVIQSAPVSAPPTGANDNSFQSELDKGAKLNLLQSCVGDMLPGERIIMFLTNLLHVSDTSGISYIATKSSDQVMWCCAMSYYRLILFSTASDEQSQLPCPEGWNPKCWSEPTLSQRVIEVPLASLDRIDKGVYQKMGTSFMGLTIRSKDCGREVQFTTPSYADTGRVYDSLNTYAFPGKKQLGYLFAFESKRQEVMSSIKTDENSGRQEITLAATRKRFDGTVEFSRLLDKHQGKQSPWTLWTSVNANYQLSPTYPSVLAGPATLDETKPETTHVILQCAAFRSEYRLPSLTWCGDGGASIWRASQPKVGLQGNRSSADEFFLRHIAESARSANAMSNSGAIYSRKMLQRLTGDFTRDWTPEHGCALKILDLRPRSAAMANRTGGYGYENTSNYLNTTLQFCNIGNIHAVRDSYNKLCGVCNSDFTLDTSWAPMIEDTKWLMHIRLILSASWETAYWAYVWRLPVLVHCSHGWDRTSQVCALAQLMLDPFYRTCEGFSVLIEKDFMSFGHPFHTRCAHGEGRGDGVSGSSQSSSKDEGQISPIFLQFLDCVFQIVNLFPDCFEFNTKYLLEFSFHVYSCRFGTLLCDTERERELLAGIRQRTYSIWDYLESVPGTKNLSFDPKSDKGVLLMPLPALMRGVSLWTERHCRFTPKPTLAAPGNPFL